jgi:soluble lytic murein transglycosylase-like protein
MMRIIKLLSMILIFYSLWFIASWQIKAGEIYSYIDANGVVHYTNITENRRPTIKLSPSSAQTQTSVSRIKIYKWVDAKGVTHYTDKPNHAGYQLIIQNKGSLPSMTIGLSPDDSGSLHEKYDDYKSLVGEIAALTQVEPALLHAMIETESGYDPQAVSPKGAVGLMQLMPATAKRFGVTDRTDATSNIYGGARYLNYLLQLFNGNLRLALAGYNAGENAVKRYGNKIPPYRETKNYVKKVMKRYRVYQAKQ